MPKSKVGASILSVITESLYDNPIVVFREYVQNSADSIFRNDNPEDYEIRIWKNKTDLFFLDNGNGIDYEQFENEMKTIGGSNKTRQKNLGYKGIGRLSGLPYCNHLIFINITDLKNEKIQAYTIDGNKYNQLKHEDRINELDFTELMDEIGNYEPNITTNDLRCKSALKNYHDILVKSNSGFLVILQNISSVLLKTINSEDGNDFLTNLKWLLPVDFDNSLYQCKQKELFEELGRGIDKPPIIKHCNIFYNDTPIFRPIAPEMLRNYVCKMDLKYATMFHCFSNSRMVIDNNNPFKGIRIYIDNMLLCTENEILQNLEHYGLLNHTINGQLQSVRCIGAIIYITDKINITSNARRTFIEVTDSQTIEFLKLINEYVDIVYDTRYSLSRYASAKSNHTNNTKRLQYLKNIALDNLKKLANEKIELEDYDDISFEKVDCLEKKRLIKKELTNNTNTAIKKYLNDIEELSLDDAFLKFIEWLKKQY